MTTALEPDVASDADVRSVLGDAEADTRKAFAQRCRAIGIAEDRKLFLGRHLSIFQMARADFRWSDGEAHRTLAVARAGRLYPRLLEALEFSAISVDQAAVLARAILNTDITDIPGFALTLEYWLTQGDRDYADFKLAVDEWVTACATPSEKKPQKDYARIRISPDGTRRFEARFGPESGSEFAEVLGEFANSVFLSDWRDGKAVHGDDMNFGLLARDDAERLAAALLLMARQAAGSDHDGTADPGVIIVVDEHTFMAELTNLLGEDPSPETVNHIRQLLQQLLDELHSTVDDINQPDLFTHPDDNAPGHDNPEEPEADQPEPTDNTDTTHQNDETGHHQEEPERDHHNPADNTPATHDGAGCNGDEASGHDHPNDQGEQWPNPRPTVRNPANWDVRWFGDPATPSTPGQRCSRLANGTPVPPARAVAAAVTGWVRFLMVDGLGNPLAASSKQRCFKGVTRQIIKAINPTCIWPGCSQPAAICQVDHVTEHHEGGPTALINAGLECGRHNVQKHLTGIVPRRDHRGIWQLYDAHTNTIIDTDILLM